MKRIIVLALFTTFSASFCSGQTVESKLYKDFANHKGSVLPDFSYVGYHRGEDAIPSPNLKVFDVTAYGAVANDNQSDKKAIQKAIKAAEANGGGIVFFPKGRFLVNEDGDDDKTIAITGSNIVFRGSGSGEGGTELFMKNPVIPADTSKLYTAAPMFQFGTKRKPKGALGQVSAAAAAGTFKIQLNTTGLHAGDWIELAMRSTNPALIKAELGDHEPDAKWTSLVKEGVNVHVIHQVKAVNGNEITLYQPLTYNIDPADQWTVSVVAFSQEVGVEHIAFVGNWTKKFVHHRSWMDDSGFRLISFAQIVNSWIVDCRFTNVNAGAIISRSAQISVLNCKVTGNPGHEAITSNGGTNVLLGKITDEASAWHSVGVANGSMNVVIWRVKYPATTCFETHSSQPRNTLLDNVEGGFMNGRGGGAIQNMPNHMQGLVFWNYKQTNQGVTPFDFWPTTTWFWKIPYPVMVGFHGADTKFIANQLKYEESTGQAVEPGSLYEAQLKLRLGKLPDWLLQLK